jgi:hypothetical protein
MTDPYRTLIDITAIPTHELRAELQRREKAASGQCIDCIHPPHHGLCTGVIAGPPGEYYGSPDDQPRPCRCMGSMCDSSAD